MQSTLIDEVSQIATLLPQVLKADIMTGLWLGGQDDVLSLDKGVPPNSHTFTPINSRNTYHEF